MDKKILFLVLLLAVLVLPLTSYAKSLEEMTGAVKTAATAIGMSLAVVGWVVAGGLYLTSAGNPSKIGVAKTALFAAVIGTVLVILANSGVPTIKGLLPGLFSE